MEQNELYRSLGSIEAKLDSLIKTLDSEQLPKRVRKLELNWAKVTGVCLVITFVLPILLKILA